MAILRHDRERRRGPNRRRTERRSASERHDPAGAGSTRPTARWLAVGAAAAVGGYALYQGLKRTDTTAPVVVARSITIERPIAEVYRFWRDLEHLPKVMPHLESVRRIDDRRSHWTVKGPAGVDVEWDAETIDDRPNERIAWRAMPDADVQNAGSVRFTALGDARTQVDVAFTYLSPGGKVGAAVAKALGREPAQQVADGLRRVKQELETGSAMTSDYASPSARDRAEA
jgi:uncharacterized membrane protein